MDTIEVHNQLSKGEILLGIMDGPVPSVESFKSRTAASLKKKKFLLWNFSFYSCLRVLAYLS